MKRIVIAGANGFLGQELSRHFLSKGWSVTQLVRDRRTALAHPNSSAIEWDGRHLGKWTERLHGAQALINLCGKSVNCRYHRRNRVALAESRLLTTKLLGQALSQTPEAPPVWLNASTAAIYEESRSTPQTETEGVIGNGFSEDLAKSWESAFFAFRLPHVRRISLRTSLVLGKGRNSVYPALARLATLGFGGAMGNGTQIVSWIHAKDFARAVRFLVEEEDISGPVNVTAPAPVTNSVFMKQLRSEIKPIFTLPQPRALLEIGAFLLRAETELVLKSRFVYPDRLLQHRFVFNYPFLDDALADLSQPSDAPKRGDPVKAAKRTERVNAPAKAGSPSI